MPRRDDRRASERRRVAITRSESESDLSYALPSLTAEESSIAEGWITTEAKAATYIDQAALSLDTQPQRRKESDSNSCKDGGEILAREVLVSVPPLDVRSYENWEELRAYVKTYSRRTYQVGYPIYSVRTGTPARSLNEKIKKSNLFCDEIPDHLQFYNKTYMCKRSGARRRRTERRAERRISSSLVAMLYLINACVRHSSVWKACITKKVTTYDHDVGPGVYETYHEARQVSDDEVLTGVRMLHRGGANRKRILEYTSENSSVQPEMKDVHNLVARLKTENYAVPTVEERISSILGGFTSENGNMARVYANEEIRHMCSTFEKFPEVLLIDATHDANISNYKLFSFMIHDALGKGQHVQHCLVENERKERCGLRVNRLKRVARAMMLWMSSSLIKISRSLQYFKKNFLRHESCSGIFTW
ncbi:LOW QUALITY PROTEIN: hypothetical protein PHPALM_28481 [Phytophthora palmivora]|uniref:ZSWIM1/3 RNaseH-like domain-containing protein n=1 Tax=Phytophthora palmivora TaxID=4796 RepID=A0A2P4X9Y3_9STRA|nr:LOW QUALITY PROTEIN: hypothetical protein PHPALM_28481 [Phytophthora palmivora]